MPTNPIASNTVDLPFDYSKKSGRSLANILSIRYGAYPAGGWAEVMHEIYIGRQPIYNNHLDVCAYELLYRPNNLNNEAGEIDHNHATTQVVLNAFLGFGLEQLVGQKQAFINLPRDFILGTLPLPFDKEHVVLEILEGIEVDDVFLNGVRKLSSEGYEIALDDFIYHQDLRPLVEASNIIKIDFLALPRSDIRVHVNELRKHKVKLLAEKIETHDDFEFARELGFDYFQGYFFCRPKVVTGQSLPSNRLAILQLLAQLQDPNIKVKSLADLVSQDIALSYKLIRGLNSALYALPKPIESIHHAIVYLGLHQIKQWVSLIALSNIPDKPPELMVVGLTRAKMCELLGEKLGENKESCFTVGLFSVLDALMDTTMKKALASLPLADNIKAALLRREGNMGRILKCVLTYEEGRWDDIDLPKVSPETLTAAYFTAVAKADQIAQSF
jgi:EAL and modified HD-GYP domain-containing signal transduction protein